MPSGKFKTKTNIVLLVSLMVMLSNAPLLLSASSSPQRYRESWWVGDGFLNRFNPIQIVQVRNNVGPGEKITLHCMSKDNELGTHVLEFGQSFMWKFRSSYGGTQFFCYLSWRQHYLDFIAYASNGLFQKDDKDKTMACEVTCVWSVKSEFIRSPKGDRLNWK